MKKGIPVFSVSDTKKVYFSKGNLQLIGENAWKFADNQWSYFGKSQSDNHRDLFGWGTGNNPNQTSEDNVDYRTFTDWGTAAASSIGTGWRTLSSAEWTYLFNTRTVNGGTGSGKSYTLGQKVNNVLGVVLYPDNYRGAVYSGSDWATFESAGCVFLPAAGARSYNVYGVNSQGNYWSSTAANTVYSYYLYITSSDVSPNCNSFKY